MKKVKRFFLYLLIVMILTNPSMQSFEGFIDKSIVGQHRVKEYFPRRISNFFVFSFYEYKQIDGFDSFVYFGFMSNFFEIGHFEN